VPNKTKNKKLRKQKIQQTYQSLMCHSCQ